MQDAWRAYLELALGVTEASRKKAEKVARKLVGKGGATAAQVQGFAEELLATSRGNREGLARLVRYEVDRALGTLGLATREEVTELSGRVKDLERQVRQAQTRAAAADPVAAGSPVARATAAAPAPAKAVKKVAAKKVARKAPAGKATSAKSTPAKSTSAGTAAGPRKTAGAARAAGTVPS
jgi:polyhydroxyalkanoate synthesis regulator phasin